jgi:hypothetical protein
MFVRSIVGTIAFCVLPLVARTAENDDYYPYKSAKVGDSVTYKVTIKDGPLSLAGSTSQTVVSKTEKEATIKVTGTISGMELTPTTQIYDITKPFDPTKISGFPSGIEATVEKQKDVKEKVKAAGKDYDSTMTTYKVKAKMNGGDFDGTVKVWMSKDMPLGVVKFEITADVSTKKENAKDATRKIEMTMEAAEIGTKK